MIMCGVRRFFSADTALGRSGYKKLGCMNKVETTCDVSASVLVGVLFFNICFNLLLHLRNKEVCLARQWNHVVDDI